MPPTCYLNLPLLVDRKVVKLLQVLAVLAARQVPRPQVLNPESVVVKASLAPICALSRVLAPSVTPDL